MPQATMPHATMPHAAMPQWRSWSRLRLTAFWQVTEADADHPRDHPGR